MSVWSVSLFFQLQLLYNWNFLEFTIYSLVLRGRDSPELLHFGWLSFHSWKPLPWDLNVSTNFEPSFFSFQNFQSFQNGSSGISCPWHLKYIYNKFSICMHSLANLSHPSVDCSHHSNVPFPFRVSTVLVTKYKGFLCDLFLRWE